MAFVKKGDYMDKEKVKQWLDTVSDACNVLIDNSYYDKENYLLLYSVACVREIHCFVTPEELRDMADVVGSAILEAPFCQEYKYKYSFFYNGIEFMCISKERLKDAGTD